MISLRTVLLAFAFLIIVFVVTHLLPVPGSLRQLMAAAGGQSILDQSPAFSTEEIYQRLDSFGQAGRELYERFLITTDVIFPLSLIGFLLLLARYTSQQLGVKPVVRRILLGFPVLFFLFDMIENASIVYLLSGYPERNEFVGNWLGYVTIMKRLSMFVAILLPVALLFLTRFSFTRKWSS